MKIIWSLRAQRDLARIVDYVDQDNPAAAERVGMKILDAAASLSRMPRRGRSSRRRNGRELVLAPLPYIIEYSVGDEAVQIVRVRHGAQR